MNIDPRTGLPEVPEGYFWRVTKSGFEWSHGWGRYWEPHPLLTVDLRKRDPKRWYHRSETSHSVQSIDLAIYTDESYQRDGHPWSEPKWRDHSDEDYQNIIRNAAIKLYERNQASLEQAAIRERTRAAVAKIMGDYPPKKVEVSE